MSDIYLSEIAAVTYLVIEGHAAVPLDSIKQIKLHVVGDEEGKPTAKKFSSLAPEPPPPPCVVIHAFERHTLRGELAEAMREFLRAKRSSWV